MLKNPFNFLSINIDFLSLGAMYCARFFGRADERLQLWLGIFLLVRYLFYSHNHMLVFHRYTLLCAIFNCCLVRETTQNGTHLVLSQFFFPTGKWLWERSPYSYDKIYSYIEPLPTSILAYATQTHNKWITGNEK